jgi:flagellar biosynthesis chaperone FliJ
MKNTNLNIKSVKLQRTFMLVIGGSGAEAMISNRRRTIDQFGSLEAMPLVRYLYLDTDPRWYEDHLSKVEQHVRISETEYIDIQFPGAAELYRGIRRGSYPNYAWFDINKLENLKSVVDGAGTVRQMARLSAWYHYPKIRDAIEKQLNALRSESVATFMREHYGSEIDDGINVHIVFGLGGGTGSALGPAEIPYLVRKILRDMGIVGAHQLIGYGVLPQAFKDLTGANALANGYAALKELNYYSYQYAPNNPLATVFGEPTWDADYLRDSVNRVRFTRQAPYDFCYLLDARNKHVDLHRKEIYQMIDRAIFHEFTGSFATFKRALRANIKNRLNRNDNADCPICFMSFGQSAAQVPLPEIKQVLAHKLALDAVQQWIDRNAGSVKSFNTADSSSEDDFVKSVVGSIRAKAGEAALVGPVREYLLRDFIQAHGLNRAGVFAGVVQEHQERLTDVPYALAEGVKQEWIAERWPNDMFVGRLKAAWEKWRTDFNDDGGDRMQWGEQIRKLEANKSRSANTIKALLRQKAFEMFEDSEHFGPAWAVCTLRQLRSGLNQLKQVFIREAGDANTIANALGDVCIIDAVTGGRGPSLSAIIEAQSSERLAQLDEAVRSSWLFNKRERVSQAAYNYLKACAHWCRARVEERARREAAELMDVIGQFLSELEEELINHASTLANLESELVKEMRAWNQKAAQHGSVGTLLYDASVIETLEKRLRERQGDQYSGAQVAQKALSAMGTNLRELKPEDVPNLMANLVKAAADAVGDLTEHGLAETEFAAHDLLSAKYRDDNGLDTALRDVIRKSSPYVRLTPAVEDGGWNEGSDLLSIGGAGLRGGGFKQNDPDKDHVRVIQSLARIGWDIKDAIKPVEDGSQIMFFQEFGGFPLRALQGVREMKDAYDQHRSQANKAPLHICTDEMAERYPDLFPPQLALLERARLVQSVGIPLGFIAQRDFPLPNGKGAVDRQYAFLRRIHELNEEQPVPLGRTVETVGLKLANSEELLDEIIRSIESVMTRASAADRAKFASQLRQYLAQKSESIRAASPDSEPQNDPAYTEERERILGFMRKHGLKAGGGEDAQVGALRATVSDDAVSR